MVVTISSLLPQPNNPATIHSNWLNKGLCQFFSTGSNFITALSSDRCFRVVILQKDCSNSGLDPYAAGG